MGERPVILEVKAPVAVTGPSSVLLSAIVGVPVVFQQKPCCVGSGEPRSVISPFPVAVVVVISVTAWVVTVEACALVGKETSLPYDVPALFVAYALT